MLLIVGSPLLLMGFFAANDLAGAIVGPPAIWNRPIHTPPREDVVGDYVESKRQLDREMGEPPATVSLHADGTMMAKGLPLDQYPGYCIVSGEGKWGVTNDGNAKINLYVLSVGSDGNCKPESYYSYIELAGRSKPYKLYWVVGDPDSGTGVWLVKK